MVSEHALQPGRLSAAAPLAAAALAILTSGLALVGWATGLPALKATQPGAVPMNPATALAAALTACSLGLQRAGAAPAARRLGRWCAAPVAALALIVLARYALGWDAWLDAVLFRDRLAGNRVAPNTALALLLLGLALALPDRPLRYPIGQLLALGALAVCGPGLVGYTFGARPLYGPTGYIPMALNTAAVLTALALGVALSRPDRGAAALLRSPGAGGAMARRLTAAAVAIPWLLGWLRLRGEQASLYDSELGVALMTVATIGLLLAVVWVTAGSLERADARRRLAEAALRQSAEEFRDLYDNAPCGYHSVGPDGTLVAANRTELRWLGYEAGEVIGRMRFADLVSPASREAYWATFERVKGSGAAADVELELVRRDGTTFPVLLNSTAVRDADGRYLRSRTTLTDLTERKRVEAAVRRLNDELEDRVRSRTAELAAANEGLRHEVTERARAEGAARESAERLRAIVETAVDGIITIDERGTVETVNPATERMFGYAAAELVGRNVSAIMPEPYRGEHDGYLANYLRTGQRKIIGIGREVRGRRKDGAVFPVELAVSETRVGSGRVFTGLVRDITERKRAEDDLRRAVAELAEANRHLGQRNDENEMFVYSVSHDLRSPLVNLQGFSAELGKACQVLAAALADGSVPAAVREQAGAVINGRMARALGFIQSAVSRLAAIIDALLRLSRAGRVEYRWERVDVNRLVARVVDSLQGTVAERKAGVSVGPLPPAWGDATALEQAFANLVGNALSYLDPARPGVIEVGSRAASEVPGAPPGATVYYVKDNGLGVAEAHRAKIFQVFQRAHPGVGKGEGLGLAVVARVVERHRGRVWVESRVGEGSTFFVALPADGRAPASDANAKGAAP